MWRRYWAAIIKQSLITLTLVFVLGFAYTRWIDNDPSEALGAGLIVVFVYFAASAILGVIHAISGAIYLWLFGGADITGGVLDDLRRFQMPPPRKFDPKNFDYLQYLAEDSGADPEERVKAAAMSASYSTLMKQAGIFRSLAIRKGADDAILRYSKEAPEPDRVRYAAEPS